MVDFKAMAQAAKAKANAAEEKKRAAEAEATRLAQELAEVARLYIVERVRPLLEQAKRDFEPEAIGCQIEEGSSFAMSRSRELVPVYYASFRCYPLDPDDRDAHVFRSASNTVRFEHDGHKLAGSYSWEGSYGMGPGGAEETMVESGIKAALERYLAKAT